MTYYSNEDRDMRYNIGDRVDFFCHHFDKPLRGTIQQEKATTGGIFYTIMTDDVIACSKKKKSKEFRNISIHCIKEKFTKKDPLFKEGQRAVLSRGANWNSVTGRLRFYGWSETADDYLYRFIPDDEDSWLTGCVYERDITEGRPFRNNKHFTLYICE